MWFTNLTRPRPPVYVSSHRHFALVLLRFAGGCVCPEGHRVDPCVYVPPGSECAKQAEGAGVGGAGGGVRDGGGGGVGLVPLPGNNHIYFIFFPLYVIIISSHLLASGLNPNTPSGPVSYGRAPQHLNARQINGIYKLLHRKFIQVCSPGPSPGPPGRPAPQA